MNWDLYHTRKKWLIEQNISPSQASEQAYWYVQEQETKEKALM
jgi:hypothetical protein